MIFLLNNAGFCFKLKLSIIKLKCEGQSLTLTNAVKICQIINRLINHLSD